MALTGDILASYVGPGPVVRRRIGSADRAEARALVTLMLACALIFVAQWPRLSREAHLNPNDIGLEGAIVGALLGWLFIAPLALYGIAGLSHLIARMFGGQATYVEARMALFWGLLAASPLWLLWGLVAGMIGPGPALDATGFVAFLAFVLLWLAGLCAVEFGARA